MVLKISFIFFIIVWALPLQGKEPTNAIEWFLETQKDKTERKSDISKPKDYKSQSLAITASDLQPIDLNGLGIIPTKITGVNPEIWRGISEKTLFNDLKSLPNLNFHAAQTFLKRVLISETSPPIPSLENNLTGKLYLIAKLDKLINIGALEEAETIINQVTPIDSALFKRLAEISFLTGRVSYMCKKLMENPGVSKDWAIRVICLSRLNEWDAAALILSSAVSLNLLNNNLEILLINYLDPNLMQPPPAFNNNSFDEIEFYLRNITKSFTPKTTDSVKYRYATLTNSNNPRNKILAAEELVIKKSINISTLFDTYRTYRINGATGFWDRMVAMKNLDRTLERNNEQSVAIALTRAIDEMYQADLIFTLASEYSGKLENYNIRKVHPDLNDSFAIIFALNGIIPKKWINYQSKNKYITMAFDIVKNDIVSVSVINDAIHLVHPSFLKNKDSNQSNQKKMPPQNEIIKIKGSLILDALQKSSAGVNTSSTALYDALVTLLRENQPHLVKSILIEYLIHYSKIRV